MTSVKASSLKADGSGVKDALLSVHVPLHQSTRACSIAVSLLPPNLCSLSLPRLPNCLLGMTCQPLHSL